MRILKHTCELRCKGRDSARPAAFGSNGDAYGDRGRDPPGEDTLRERAFKKKTFVNVYYSHILASL